MPYPDGRCSVNISIHSLRPEDGSSYCVDSFEYIILDSEKEARRCVKEIEERCLGIYTSFNPLPTMNWQEWKDKQE